MDRQKCRASRPWATGGKPPVAGRCLRLSAKMNSSASSKNRHRIRFDAEPGFEAKVRLLAAKWGVKTNVAIQRAVDLANARKWSDDEKALLKNISLRVEDLVRFLHLP